MEPRLRADFRVKAILRRVEQAGANAMIVAKGEASAGAVLIKHNRFALDCRVYAQTRTAAGEPAWVVATGADAVDDAAAERIIARQRGFDPDLWVIEVEDPHDRWSLDEPLL